MSGVSLAVEGSLFQSIDTRLTVGKVHSSSSVALKYTILDIVDDGVQHRSPSIDARRLMDRS